MQDRRKKPALLTEIVRERISRLLSLAKQNSATSPPRSKRYVQLARKLSTRYLVRLTREQKKLFCKKCNSFLIPGRNLRIRLRNKAVERKCAYCGYLKRIPFKRTP